MSTREFAKTQIDTLSEEKLKIVLDFISIQQSKTEKQIKEIKKPLSIHDMTKEEFDAEIQKGLDSIEAGRVFTPEEVSENLQRLYEKHGL